jgi:1,4-alpha-glucan branching enzyme
MPYVEGFGTWPFGEEWLFEAIATAYLPLLELFERWGQEGATGVVTVGVTPVLADQLVLPEVRERFLRFIREVRVETHRLDIEGLLREGEDQAAEALRRSATLYARAADRFEALDGRILESLRALRDAEVIDLWTSAATHAVLPLLATDAGVRLQVRTGIDAQRERFGGWSGGFWLPECAFRAGIDEQLAREGVRAFCVYPPGGRHCEPIAAGDSVAIPIDWSAISLVWDERGYPADPIYRDYHAHTLNGLRPYANGGGAYRAEPALARAREHARDFLGRVGELLDDVLARRGAPGLVVCALDTELLGHWWHEGPAWLDAVVEGAADHGVALCTLPAGLERHEPKPLVLPTSSWGEGKDLSTWDSPAVADLVWPARRAELRLLRALGCAGASARAALERGARELLALQSSDWSFMAARKLAADYPTERVRSHHASFERAIHSALADGEPIEPRLRGLAPGLRLETMLDERVASAGRR